MVEMFRNARSFNQPISRWNTGAVTSRKDMFEGASSFTFSEP
jgi:surface protein